jgi:protein tyrosine phosphatase (PTP) superfamily phosphohydrolase (DUF442 family)
VSNTMKSVLRFYKSVFGKYLPFKSEDKSIEDVVNYVNYNDCFVTSGQPTKRQFFLIRKEGYAVVINLAPCNIIENPLKHEEAIVIALGMQYVHIPVNMLKPAQEDFDTFVDTMSKASGEKIWVHCAIGMRASAFLCKYRWSFLGEDKQSAMWDLRETWEPFGQWIKFVFGEKAAPFEAS